MDKEIKSIKPKLRDYEPIIGKSSLEELKTLADKLSGKTVQNINSTYIGGGVAEILSRMVPFLNELGIDARWSVIKGDTEFFNITKKFHNALHGRKEMFTEEEFEYFLEINRKNAEDLEFAEHVIFVHDPQPVALVKKRNEIGEKWIWRCHIDISNPDKTVWNFIKNMLKNMMPLFFQLQILQKCLH